MNALEIQKKWPKTVDEAVARILIVLSEKDKETIKNNKSEIGVCEYHHGLGTWIRNNFGLWHGNKELIQSCGGHAHPDDCSTVILNALWEKLRTGQPKSS